MWRCWTYTARRTWRTWPPRNTAARGPRHGSGAHSCGGVRGLLRMAHAASRSCMGMAADRTQHANRPLMAENAAPMLVPASYTRQNRPGRSPYNLTIPARLPVPRRYGSSWVQSSGPRRGRLAVGQRTEGAAPHGVAASFRRLGAGLSNRGGVGAVPVGRYQGRRLAVRRCRGAAFAYVGRRLPSTASYARACRLNRRRVESAEKDPYAALPVANRISRSGMPAGALFSRLRSRNFVGTRLRPAAPRGPPPRYNSSVVHRSEKPYRPIIIPGMIAVLRRPYSGRAFTRLLPTFVH